MYLDHYNLNLKPFEMSPDPRFLWLGEKHKEALAALEYGILENKGFLVLTGEAGAGKTVLINGLLESPRVNAIIGTIPDPDLEILDFFNVLAEEFKMNRTFESKGSFLIVFKHFLHEVYESEGKVLLISYLIFNFAWRNVSVVELKENIHSLKNSGSEKESPKSDDGTKGDVDNEKASEKDQRPSTTDQEKFDEKSDKDA